jgi:hypothetical protein
VTDINESDREKKRRKAAPAPLKPPPPGGAERGPVSLPYDPGHAGRGATRAGDAIDWKEDTSLGYGGVEGAPRDVAAEMSHGPSDSAEDGTDAAPAPPPARSRGQAAGPSPARRTAKPPRRKP